MGVFTSAGTGALAGFLLGSPAKVMTGNNTTKMRRMCFITAAKKSFDSVVADDAVEPITSARRGRRFRETIVNPLNARASGSNGDTGTSPSLIIGAKLHAITFSNFRGKLN
jgi:hypothetical protein